MNTRVDIRYAKALFELAKERGELDQAFSDAQYLIVLCILNREFKAFLISPVVKPLRKVQVFQLLFEGKMSPLTLSFLTLILKKNREADLSNMMQLFITKYKKERNINTVKLTTADSISDETKADFKRRLQEKLGGSIELIIKEDVGLIGGYTLQYEDKLLDFSLQAKFMKIKHAFLENNYKKGI